jgi:hypothetical protein
VAAVAVNGATVTIPAAFPAIMVQERSRPWLPFAQHELMTELSRMTTITAGPAKPPGRGAALFAGTLATSAALLFLVQPMITKLILPLFGGSPAVWNTAMLFFQAALLAGYAYAH